MVELKIGRDIYQITENDKFLDNGDCIKIITQKGRRYNHSYESIVLTKKAIREISKFERVNLPCKHGNGFELFSLILESKDHEKEFV